MSIQKMKTTIAGTAYVHTSNAVLLAQHHQAVAEWRKLTLNLAICLPLR
jgi:hypothetical protein